MIRKYCMKYLLVVCAFFAVGYSWADPRDDISDRTKPVWNDYTLNLFQYFIENIPFNTFSNALCVFDMTRYWEHTNFMENLEGEPSAYALSLNYNECSESDTTIKSVVLATQEAPASPTIIDYWKSSIPDSELDYRRRARVDEEPTAVNPLGIVDINTELVDKPSKTMLAKTRHQSVRNEQGLIEHYVVIYIDSIVSGYASRIGQSEEYYSSRVIWTSANSGYGTIVYKSFGNHGYPEGRANFTTMNIAFDDTRFKSQTIESGNFERCIARQGSWLSVNPNGYGVYDEQGDRFGLSFEGTYVASDGVIVPISTSSGTTVYSPRSCRLSKDGSLSPSCSDGAKYYYDPVPDLTVATLDGPGPSFNQYGEPVGTDYRGYKVIIRQLRPLTVQPLLESSECDDLEFQPTLAVKDSNYLEEVALSKPIASSGAIMVNNYGSQKARDLLYNGVSYAPTGDPDGDGVPNYLDAYPEDSSRDYDKDYDGVGDATDATDDRFVFDHSTFFTPNAVEVLSPGMAVPE